MGQRCHTADDLLAREVLTKFVEAPLAPLLRFVLFVKPGYDGCWLWDGFIDADGYGQFNFDWQSYRAHRISCIWRHGDIPEGSVPDHLCRHRDCVNPDHLEIVTIRENILRGDTITAKNAAKTHCPRGHLYNEENTYVWPKRRMRHCRICTNENSKAWQKKRRLRRGLRIGSKRADTVLDEIKIVEIKRLLGQTSISLPKIAKQYNVVPGTIYKINKNETWTYVPWPEGCSPRKLSNTRSTN